MKKSFRNLFIWQRSMDLAVDVLDFTGRLHSGHQVLSRQMQRSALSIPSNIAEGTGRASAKELSRYLFIARGSACELETQMEIARRVGVLDESAHAELERRLAQITTGINRFLATMKERE